MYEFGFPKKKLIALTKMYMENIGNFYSGNRSEAGGRSVSSTFQFCSIEGSEGTTGN